MYWQSKTYTIQYTLQNCANEIAGHRKSNKMNVISCTDVNKTD